MASRGGRHLPADPQDGGFPRPDNADQASSSHLFKTPFPSFPSSFFTRSIAPAVSWTPYPPPPAAYAPPAPFPGTVAPSATFSTPVSTKPTNHSPLLLSAVESALWTGDLPSLGGTAGTTSEASVAATPSPSSSSFSGPSSLSGGYRSSSLLLSPVQEVDESLPGSPPAIHSSSNPPSVGTSATGGAPAAGLTTEHLIKATFGVQSDVKPFIQKLSHLLSHPDAYADCFSWDAAGTAFIIHHNKRLHTELLPSLFSHSNSASLTRQLNVYGFRRLNQSELSARIDVLNMTGYSGWIHSGFTRDDKDSLHLLVPRPSRARQLKREGKEAADEARGGGRRGGLRDVERERYAEEGGGGGTEAGKKLLPDEGYPRKAARLRGDSSVYCAGVS